MTKEEEKIMKRIYKTIVEMFDVVGLDEEIEAYVQNVQNLKTGLPYRLKLKIKLELIEEDHKNEKP